MKKFFVVIIGLLIIFNCSKDKNPVVSSSHPSDWNEKNGENFHGTKVLEAGYLSCKSCHGNDLQGGKSKVSCFECHQTYPHPPSWNIISNSNFHASYIANNGDGYCKSCHGTDYKGGKSGVSCFTCHSENSLP